MENKPVVSTGSSTDRSKLVKVAAASRSQAVAGAIAGIMREKHTVEVQAIGAGAVYQAVKALIHARNYLKDDGIDLVCTVKFINLEIEGNERTALRFTVETCSPRNYL